NPFKLNYFKRRTYFLQFENKHTVFIDLNTNLYLYIKIFRIAVIPIIKEFEEKYKTEKLIVVADAGMLSKENIHHLTEQGYEYILGARIKNEGQNVKDQIIELKLEDGQSTVINQQEDNNRLVINYSVSRAAKDAYNRQKGIDRLRKQIKSGKLTKKHINNRGYNKFLQIDQEVSISVNEELIKDDQKWDGLKGYKTNTHLGADKILESYTNLWKIEKAFRISKTDLKVRPIYHRAKRRIEAHICITFAAYKVYKELERQLKEKKSTLSVEKAISIAKTIQQITIVHPKSNETVSKMLILTEEQRKLAQIFDF
ncbi:MAG: transposase, partial [Saprospiraceae bacterium]